jgi:aminomethyltransferase
MPREGYEVVYNDEVVGKVVTGLYAPTVEKFAGHAYVPAAIAKSGTEIYIKVRGKLKKALIIRRPFYRPAYK